MTDDKRPSSTASEVWDTVPATLSSHSSIDGYGVSWSQHNLLRCPTCSAVVPSTHVSAHVAWHESLTDGKGS